MFDVHRTSAAAYSVTVDGDTFRYRDSNQAVRNLCGLTFSQFTDLTPQDCFPPAVAERVLAYYRACRDGKHAISYVFEAALKSGLRRWRTTLFPEINPGGLVVGLFGICIDTAGEACGATPEESFQQKISLAFDTMDGGFWVYELATGTFEMSRSLTELIAGPSQATLSLAEYIGYVHEDDLPRHSVLRGDIGLCVEFRVITYDGRLRWLRSKRRVVTDENGIPVRMVSHVTDITDQKVAVETLEAKASTDSLTALANRRAFDSFGTLTWSRARSAHGTLHLVLFDLDGFKPVNDRYGHRAGDQVLRQVARRAARIVAKGDLLARIGGDEFAMIVQSGDEAALERVSEKLRRAFAKPFDLDGLAVGVGVSIGHATLAPSDRSFAALVERADRALYIQKRQHQLLSA